MPSDPNGKHSDETSRSSFLDEVIAEYIRACEAGHPPDRDELLAEHPDLADELREFFANRDQMDQVARPMRDLVTRVLNVRCPHCHNPIELLDEAPLADISCPSCGSSFSLVGDKTEARYPTGSKMIGHFELLGRVGIGAFGSVWKARDTKLDRTVAIKIPRRGQLDESETEMFLRDARAAAQLKHPNIVGVHEVGKQNGTIYIVSDFIEGVTLKGLQSERQLAPREAAELCVKIAKALHHAHESGVIHRDLKPSNIMMDNDDQPHIVDFGLAKREAGEITMTVEGQILGTPAYMCPEQARGEGYKVDCRADVYSLGVILFELLTGELPFRGEKQMLIVQILKDDPPSPRKLNSSVPRDLETICLKCIEKDPGQRYGVASELRDELRRFIDGKPIRARPITGVTRTWRWCKRNPVIASLSTAVTVLLLTLAIAGPIVAIKQARLADRNERLADDERRAKEDANKKTQQLADQSLELQKQLRIATAMRLAAQSQSIRDELPVQSLLLAVEAVEATRRHDGQTLPLAHQCLRDGLAELGGKPCVGHEDIITDSAISPDGRWLVTGSTDTTVRLWDLTTDDPTSASLVLRGHEGPVSRVAISPDSRWLATGSREQTVRVWDLKAGDPESASFVLRGHEGGVYKIAFSPDCRWLATGSRDQTVRVWDLKAGDPESASFVLRGHEGGVYKIAFSPDCRWLVTKSSDDSVRLRDLTESDPAALTVVLKGIMFLEISPDSRWLAAGSPNSGTTQLFDLSSNVPVTSAFRLPEREGRTEISWPVAISSDSRWLMTRHRWHEQNRIPTTPETTALWDLAVSDPAASAVVVEDNQSWSSNAISPDARWLVTGGSMIRLTADDPAASAVVLRGYEGRGQRAAISPDSRWLVTSHYQSGYGGVPGGYTIALWDLTVNDPGDSAMVLLGHEDRIEANYDLFAISPDSRWLVNRRNREGTVRLWDLTADDPTASAVLLRGHEAPVYTVAISPDSRWLVTKSDDKTARIWDLHAKNPGASSFVLRGHEGHVLVNIDPNGRWIVTQGGGTVRLWDLTAEVPDASASAEMLLSNEARGFSSVTMSPNGRWLVTISDEDQTTRLWDLNAHRLTASMVVLKNNQGGGFYTALIGPNSRWLAGFTVKGRTTGETITYLWDLTENAPATTAVKLAAGRPLAISPNGRWLVTLGKGARHSRETLLPPSYRWAIHETAKLWDLTAEDPASSAVVLRGHEGSVDAIVIGPNSRWLVIVSHGTTRIWDLDAKSPAVSAVIPESQERLSISADGRWLVTYSDYSWPRLWDLSSDDPAALHITLKGLELTSAEFEAAQTDGRGSVAGRIEVSPNGRWLVMGSLDKAVRLWDLSAVDPASSRIVLRGHERPVDIMHFSPDSRLLVTVSGKDRIWDLTASDPAATAVIVSDREVVRGPIAISADNRWLVKGSMLWDLAASDPASTAVVLRGHKGSVRRVAISPLGNRLVTVGSDRTIRL